MCGRAYETYTDEELAIRYLNRKTRIPILKPNYNLAPTQEAPVVYMKELGERAIGNFRWGLIPHWAKDTKIAYSTINAKAETVDQKPAYRSAFKHRRCIVPLSGFYEWKKEGEKTKRPFAIHLKSRGIMSVAGVWETWNPPQGGDPVHSFSIITTGANERMRGIHDRMPVILDPKDEEEWLDPGHPDPARLKRLLKPCPPEWLEAYEVSTLVNSPRNNAPEVLKAVG